MNPTLDAALRSWPFDPWLLAALSITAGIYVRGWLSLRRRDPRRWQPAKLAAFSSGLAAIYLALASPIEPFSAFLLSAHMLQHLLLMMVAAPLVWLGAPLVPLLRGLPRPIRAVWIAPLFRSRPIRLALARLTNPAAALSLFVAATWLWHLPAAYDLALRSSGRHYLQHACFFATSLLFWYPVVRPYPDRSRRSDWLMLPYLLAADLQNTLLSALLTFSARPLYPYYSRIPRLSGVSVEEDQAIAGVIMWVVGSLAYLAPLVWIGIRLLYDDRTYATPHVPAPIQPDPLSSPRSNLAPFDLLRLPVIGRFLKSPRARLALQLPLSVMAILIIFDGLLGPQVGAMNLAGVLPWIHWRGLVVLGLLVVGNVFCMACPFMLPRTLARRLLPAGWHWPRWLRNKWLAVLLLGLFFWAYEAFSLWDSPRWTAWIAVGYFVAALAIDGLFRGAAFCKYVCPIGQFNFVQSLVSPFEVKVRDQDVCTTCRTKECIRGSDEIPGCELKLYQPRKAGNLDCTFCLDCVHSCPHENVGILAVTPGRELWRNSVRSGIGRFSRRADVAALVLVLVFGAFANAAGMVGPVVDWEERLRSSLGLHSTIALTTAFYLFALVVAPLALVGSAAMISRRWGQPGESWLETATRWTFALVPLGFAMWLAHYFFHFATSFETIVPTTQRFAADLGWTALGEPLWTCCCCGPVSDWLPHLQILFLDVGLLLSLYVGYRIALRAAGAGPKGNPGLPPAHRGFGFASSPGHPDWLGALKAFVPWSLVMLLLFAAGVWIVLQPMQMRGMLPTSG
jgi:cytochrome c oxidase assembly factor CtaG/polyferredoxin